MHREIKELQFPPRWSGFLNHGYGYPLFLFTYPLPYLVGELFHIAGLGVVDTVKLLFIATTFGGAFTMFLFARSLWGSWGGVLSAALYMYAPYSLVNLTKRGSLGELTAFVFYPLLFHLFTQLLKRPTPRILLLTALSIGAFILSHNASVVLFLPFLIVWIWGQWRQKKSINLLFMAVISVIIGLLLSAWFWLPALFEKKFIALSQISLADKSEHFLSLPVLLGGGVHALTGLSLQIGNLHLFLWIVTLIILSGKGMKSDARKYVTFFSFMTLAAILLLTSLSTLIWKLPLLADIDFPWRMLGTLSFLLSVIGGALVTRRLPVWSVVSLIIIAVFSTQSYLSDVSRKTEPDAYYETNDATTTSHDELMPITVTEKPGARPMEKAYFVSRLGKVKVERETSTELKLTTKSSFNEVLVINTLFFPGWKAVVDGINQPITITKDTGLISMFIPDGQHKVELQFGRTPVRWVADLMSIFGVLLLIYIWTNSKKIFPS